MRNRDEISGLVIGAAEENKLDPEISLNSSS